MLKAKSKHDIYCKRNLLESFGINDKYYDCVNENLRDHGLTNPRKEKIHANKIKAITKVINEEYLIVCKSSICNTQISEMQSKNIVITEDASYCEICSGSDTQRYLSLLSELMKKHQFIKICIVGGYPSSFARLSDGLNFASIRRVDGQKNVNLKRAKQLSSWADVLILWCPTPVGHSTTSMFKNYDNCKMIYSPSVLGFCRELINMISGRGNNHVN